MTFLGMGSRQLLVEGCATRQRRVQRGCELHLGEDGWFRRSWSDAGTKLSGLLWRLLKSSLPV